MFAIFQRYYLATSAERFDSDLSGKDALVILRDAGGRLRGFSTLAVTQCEFSGGPVRVVFSGDTIVERACWGSPALAFSWIRHIGEIAREAPGVPLYWLLIVKGHRTYRYLPAFGLEFTPDWRKPADAGLHALKGEIAAQRFGTSYDHATGIIRADAWSGHLAPEWASVSPREARRPDVRFFMAMNPGCARGDELVCLCSLSPDNMRPLARRIYLHGTQP